MLDFLKHNFNKYINTVLLYLSVLVIVFISLYVLFYQLISFDGAMHSQAAINFYKYGKYLTDYPIGFTQIKVPFQLVNGFFLTLFGMNFMAASMANILFYILFGWLFFMLNKETNSNFIFLGFILISFSSSFLKYGFGGYGEIPGLVFGLIGLFFLVKWNASFLKILFGAFLVGTAVATKWIFVLILLPFGIVLLIQLINKNYKYLLFAVSGIILSLAIFWSIEYAYYSVSFKQLINGILEQTSPTNNSLYSNYSERISVFWVNYITLSGSVIIALIKIVAYLQLSLLLIFLSAKIVLQLKRKETTPPNQLYLLLISLFALEYFVWWFFISSIPWYRRGFNADVLLIIALALSTNEIFRNIRFQKIIHYSATVIISIILIFSIYDFFSLKPKEVFASDPKSVVVLESQMRTGLNLLPQNFVGYGYGWWQAPRWSFLSGAKHKDLTIMSLDEKHEIINHSKKYFVFFGPENLYNKKLNREIHEKFDLSTIFKYHNYSIERIDGIVGADTSQVRSIVNYSSLDYIWADGVYSRDKKDYCWYSTKARILLNAENKTEFILTFRIPDIKKFSSLPTLTVLFNNDLVYEKQIITKGKKEIIITVEDKHKRDNLMVSLEMSSPFRAINDARDLGIVVSEIGFR